jgi:predicted RNase H-like HicB family nuclease
MTRHLELPVVLIPDDDGGYVVECPVIPGCISQADTREEALANIKDAIALCLENQAAEGWEVPAEVEVTKVAVWTEGNVYRVVGIEAGDLRIISDEGRPFLFPRDAFELVFPEEPDDWVATVGVDGERYAYPPQLGRVGFFEDYFANEPNVVSTFREYMSALCRPTRT